MVTIGLAGDVMIGRCVNAMLRTAPPQYVWGDLLPLLRRADFNMVNFEAALTHSACAVPKVFNFRSDPRNVQVLKEGGIHAVNIANNHILDFSEEGLLETLEVLDAAHILHVGAGKNLKRARAPSMIQCKDVKIGFIGCTDNEESWQASEAHPGTFYVEVGDLSALQTTIFELRSQVDLLILSIHWGPNMRTSPSVDFQTFAHALIDAGVDILHGHSAHLFQGVELYHGKIILYDTGDFIDDYAVDPHLRNDRSFYFQIDVDRKEMQCLRMIPVVISNFQVNRARGPEAKEILQRMQQLSLKLHTSLQQKGEELILAISKK